ncbi:hypothetical protein LX36DRAFT_258386 [Colletotrichum falcatum]|nr:hypothetical protein LX36DRAFT_258386 [Colletotrichum falcatum]
MFVGLSGSRQLVSGKLASVSHSIHRALQKEKMQYAKRVLPSLGHAPTLSPSLLSMNHISLPPCPFLILSRATLFLPSISINSRTETLTCLSVIANTNNQPHPPSFLPSPLWGRPALCRQAGRSQKKAITHPRPVMSLIPLHRAVATMCMRLGDEHVKRVKGEGLDHTRISISFGETPCISTLTSPSLPTYVVGTYLPR